MGNNALTILMILLLLPPPPPAFSVDVSPLLSTFPDFSEFNRLLSSSSVTAELSLRSSVTLLALSNTQLAGAMSSLGLSSVAPVNLADVLRYHVLLEYLSWSDLRRIPTNGKLITTLYQTTGRASSNLGFLNLTRSPLTNVVSVGPPSTFSSTANATILSLLKSLPYNLTIFSVDSLLVPYGFDLFASETQPVPPPVNVTRVLVDGKDFNVVTSMLTASGVAAEFEADERGGPGITIFAPTDEAFAAETKVAERFQSLSADKKATVLRFHVLHSYYPLGSLESMVNPVQPTLATESAAAGRFTLNITRINGTLAIDTGLVQTSITRTVFDQNPVAVFAVSRVLLPKEIFGDGNDGAAGVFETAAPPQAAAVGMAPEYPPPEGKGEISSSSPPLIGESCTGFFLIFFLFFFSENYLLV